MTALVNPPPTGAGEQGRYEAVEANERAIHDARRHLAVHAVARHATSRGDCLELLEMLGLADLLPAAATAPATSPSDAPGTPGADPAPEDREPDRSRPGTSE